MRTKRLSLWPKPPWCISIKKPPLTPPGLPWSYHLQSSFHFIITFTIGFFHNDAGGPPPLNPLFQIFHDGTLVNSGPYPVGIPDVPVTGVSFFYATSVTGKLFDGSTLIANNTFPIPP